MTRFEMAAILSRRLYMLTEEEKHSIIDKYILEADFLIEDGMSEADAVAQLGNIDDLADRILMRHHINPQRFAAPQPDSSTQQDEPQPELIEEPAAETLSAAKNVTTAAAEKPSKITDRTGLFMTKLFRNTEKLTLSFTCFLLFTLVWLPSMLITAIGVICTAAATFIWLFTGIGFAGICIAGTGCCMVGITFCLWLGASLTGGKKYEKDI